MLPRIVIATPVGGRDLPFQRVCDKLAKKAWNYTVSFVLDATITELRIFDTEGRQIDAYVDSDMDDFVWIESVYTTQLRFAEEQLAEKVSLLQKLVAYSEGGPLRLSDDDLQTLARERRVLLDESVREGLMRWFGFMDSHVHDTLSNSVSALATWPYEYDAWLVMLNGLVEMTKQVISKAVNQESTSA